MTDTMQHLLLKAALILSGEFASHLAYSQPQSTNPDSEERQKYTSKTGDFAGRSFKVLRRGLGVCYLSLGLAETAVLLAHAFPSPLSERIIATLCPKIPDVSKLMITPAFLVAWVSSVAGCTIRLACHRKLGRFFTHQLAIRKDHKLITSGPYAIVRHPSYTGALLNLTGFMVLLLGRNSYVQECGMLTYPVGKIIIGLGVAGPVAGMLMLVMRTSVEDQVLKGEFGEQWIKWSKKTPYKLFPGIF